MNEHAQTINTVDEITKHLQNGVTRGVKRACFYRTNCRKVQHWKDDGSWYCITEIYMPCPKRLSH